MSQLSRYTHMDEPIQETNLTSRNAELPGIDLGRWLGRREAFGLIAGRCSAAEVESLRRIREEKQYRLAARNWNEFCVRYLKVNRRNVDRAIGYLQEFGPAFFHISQLTHIAPQDFRAIAAHVTEDGVQIDGKLIALLPENTDQLTEAIHELLQQIETNDSAPSPQLLDIAVKRCRNLSRLLAAMPADLDENQKLHLAEGLHEVCKAASQLGVLLAGSPES